MSRRPDPVRIDEARQAALRSRLAATGIASDRVDEWIEAWTELAAVALVDRGPDYWTQAWEWISAEREAGRRP